MPSRPERSSHPTLSDVVPRDRAGVRLRQVATGLLTLAVVVGAAGGFGVRQDEVVATDGSLTLTVLFPSLARAGNDAAFAVTVSDADGLGEEVELTVDRRYLDLWESQRFYPEPSEETAEGDRVVLTFDAPDSGTTMTVRYDAYLQPVALSGASGTVEARVGDDAATARFTTTVVP